MAFYRGSFSSGLFKGAQDAVGMFDTIEQTKQRRALTKQLEQEMKMKQDAFDAASKATLEATQPTDRTGPSASSNGFSPGAASGADTGTTVVAQRAASAADNAVTAADLGTLPTPNHMRALIPTQYGTPAPTPAPAAPSNSPIGSTDPGYMPAGTSNNAPIGSTSEIPPAPHRGKPGVSTGDAPPASRRPGDTLAPWYAPARPPQYLAPQQGIPTGPAPPGAAASAPPQAPRQPSNTMSPWYTPGSPLSQNMPAQGIRPATPNLASSEQGMGASILAAMNPMAGPTA